jgi:hypothetical protein
MSKLMSRMTGRKRAEESAWKKSDKSLTREVPGVMSFSMGQRVAVVVDG